MAILEFQRPDQVIMLEGGPKKGIFQFRPLEPGYGITIGNALRRILLSSLEGFAISSVHIQGVDHEFTTIPGVKEDVAHIILNLKQVRFKALSENIPTESVTISITGKSDFKAGQITNFLTGFEILNPELVICHMDDKVNLKMDITLRKGRGYITADENASPTAPFGVIAIDSIHTPIVNVKYQVENYRVEQKTDYEMLTLEIQTDGSISPKDALMEAANILVQHFALFSGDSIHLPTIDKGVTEEYDSESQAVRQLLRTPLADLNLSVRALNCLRAAEVYTIADLVSYSKADLMKFRNFGRKSLAELEEIVAKIGLSFGLDVEKYKIDKN